MTVGALFLLLAGVAWIAPVVNLKDPTVACESFRVESSESAPSWTGLEASIGYDIDVLQQNLRCTWSKGDSTYVRTYGLHGTLSTWLLAGTAGSSLASLVAAAARRQTRAD